MSNEFYWIAVVLTTILSAARIARLLVADKFPPAAWVRNKYADLTDNHGDWQWLFFCGYCMSPWTTALVVATGLLAGVYDGPTAEDWTRVWWIVNGILAMSYLAAVFIAHDGDDD